MSTYDCFPFCGELDLLEIRLNELDEVVDKFVLVEATRTHSGKTKPLYFKDNSARFSQFLGKIIHIVVDDYPPADMAKLGQSWIYERHQRDAISRGLINCSDDDIIISSDIDEIPRAETVRLYDVQMGLAGLNQSMHTYWLNCVNRDTEYAWCKILPYRMAKSMTHCGIRYANNNIVLPNGGWHFSFMGNIKDVITKIESWAHQEYNNKIMKDERNIRNIMEFGIDPHGRNVKYVTEPLDNTYPNYVVLKKEKFKHLIKEVPMPSKDWNLKVWDKDYQWTKDGNEWSEMADFCGVPYDQWKKKLVASFVTTHIKNDSVILEIGSGHGRWSEILAPLVKKLILADLSPSCIRYCQKKLENYKNIEYNVNDGSSLTSIGDNSVDFVWSFDTFVHIEESELKSYAKELYRVMKRHTSGCIHHSDRPDQNQKNNGCRSSVTADMFKRIFINNGFYIIKQVDSWGSNCNVKMAGDMISVFVKP